MLLVDIEDFKDLNDRLRQAAGDELLIGVTRVVNTNVRTMDQLARDGGPLPDPSPVIDLPKRYVTVT